MKIQISGWHQRGIEEADKGIPLGDRIFDILIIFVSVLAIIFLRSHEVQNTGFIKGELNTYEATMLYGFWIIWIITATLQGVLGQKFLSRKFDIFGGIPFLVISIIYMTIKFPFNFKHVSDTLPNSLSFISNILTNDSARAGMGILIILLVFALVYSPIAYKFIKIQK